LQRFDELEVKLSLGKGAQQAFRQDSREMNTSNRHTISFSALACMVALLVASGCGSSFEPRSKVSGSVSVNGEAVTAGTVLFLAEEGQGASATLTSDGLYSLNCPPGRYHVAVCPPARPDPLVATNADISAYEKLNKKIPTMYQDVGTSGIIAEVKLGQNSFDIQLKK
jgi:hypothetical protein